MLAIHGGTPVRSKAWGDWPIITEADKKAVMSVFDANCFTGFRAGQYDGGPKVKELEQKIANHTGSAHAISFDTWSNGIFAILLALGIKPGDEVILPTYTMTACASMIIACGAVPIFVDIDKSTCNISPELIQNAITLKTKAIMAVHLFGFSSDIEKISKIAEYYDLWLIEDCAQSPYTFFNNKRCGTFGDVGGFSFTQNKHVMSGEGGCAITNNEQINNSLRYLRNHGEVCTFPELSQNFATNLVRKEGLPGFNFRMTEMSAALACSQWDSLLKETQHRQLLSSFLNEEFKSITNIDIFQQDNYNSSYFLYPLRYTGKASKSTICKAINAEGINVLDGYCKPIYRQSLYSSFLPWSIKEYGNLSNYLPNNFPNTELIQYNELLVFTDVRSPNTLDDMKDIVMAVKKVLKFYE